MNPLCNEIRDLAALAAGDDLDAEEDARLREHVQACPECAAEWTALEAARAAVLTIAGSLDDAAGTEPAARRGRVWIALTIALTIVIAAALAGAWTRPGDDEPITEQEPARDVLHRHVIDPRNGIVQRVPLGRLPPPQRIVRVSHMPAHSPLRTLPQRAEAPRPLTPGEVVRTHWIPSLTGHYRLPAIKLELSSEEDETWTLSEAY